MNEHTTKEIVEEMYRRQQAGDPTVLDDLVAEDLVNHAAGPPGREGLKRILRTIDEDLGPLSVPHEPLTIKDWGKLFRTRRTPAA